MNIELIRNNIIARRNELGYSQEYVAVLLGISTNSYSKIENGHTAIISKRLFQIATALKTSVDELVLGENITLREHQKICKELEEKYNTDIAYYRQHIDSCNLTIKTLQEAAQEKEAKIKELTAQIARLQKQESYSAGAVEIAGQYPATGAEEIAVHHPVTGATEYVESQQPVAAEMEDMTEPDDLPMNIVEPDGISRLV